MKNRVFYENLTKSGGKSANDFNRDFWANIPGEKKIILAWEMLKEVNLFKGEGNVSQPRLQRSVQNIERRKS